MHNTIRLGAFIASLVSLAACSSESAAPLTAPAGPSASAAAVAKSEQLAYRIVDNRFTGMHIDRLPCDEFGNPGEFVRVAGEYHVWGRVPAYDPDVEEPTLDGSRHFQLHVTFEGSGTTLQSGRTFDVSERELDVFNGAVTQDAERGTGTWRLTQVFIERATGKRITSTGTAKIVIDANGNIVVDRIYQPSCGA